MQTKRKEPLYESSQVEMVEAKTLTEFVRRTADGEDTLQEQEPSLDFFTIAVPVIHTSISFVIILYSNDMAQITQTKHINFVVFYLQIGLQLRRYSKVLALITTNI
jgi:hypothetical protein